ncbi:CCR4- associated factor 1b [Hibiscus trionum]|uniref:poly(A)-specific ribonuclease n=1 Tax=Hibiscus trionum TaxID=183268 RepID=A0A9W7JDS7_HIBTR|nr:CCR4- associated factor 1b [Hibiscus trionum]
MMSVPVEKKPVMVRRVFAEDLEREFDLITHAISDYCFVSVDTEFPGTIFKPDIQTIREGNPEINYHYMKSNVDELKIIQLGLTLSDVEGNLPDFGTPFGYVWEFNFKDFDVDRDLCDSDSIELLTQQGIDFAKNKEKGIDSSEFAKLLLNSGLVFNPFVPRVKANEIFWVAFHGAYDFGFLLKILAQNPLPFDFQSFMCQLAYYFGYKVFDIKHTFKFFGLQGGLEKVARTLNVARVAGSSHQAGSDSLLTLDCFMKFWNAKVFECHPNQREQMLPPLALYGLIQAV